MSTPQSRIRAPKFLYLQLDPPDRDISFIQLIAHSLRKYNCVATESSREGYYWSPERYEGNVWTPILHRHRAIITPSRTISSHIPTGTIQSTYTSATFQASAQSTQRQSGLSPSQFQSNITYSAAIDPRIYSNLIVSPVFVPQTYFSHMDMHTSHSIVDTYLALDLPITNGLCTLEMALGPDSDAREYAIKVAPDTGSRDTWVLAKNFRKLDDNWNETDWSPEEQAMPIFKAHRKSWQSVNSLKSANLSEAKLEYDDSAMLKVCLMHETLKFIAGRYGDERAPISLDRFDLSVAFAANMQAIRTRFSGMIGLEPAGSSPSYNTDYRTFLETLVHRDIITRPRFYMRILPPDIHIRGVPGNSQGITSFICFGEWPCSKRPPFVEIPLITRRSWSIKLVSITLLYPKPGSLDYEEVEISNAGNAVLDCGTYTSVVSEECHHTLYARKGAQWVAFKFSNAISGQIYKIRCDARTFLYHRDGSNIDHEVVIGTSALVRTDVILGLNFFRCVFIGFNDVQGSEPFVQIAPAYRSEVAQYRYTV